MHTQAEPKPERRFSPNQEKTRANLVVIETQSSHSVDQLRKLL
jgi:hypothetical protein